MTPALLLKMKQFEEVTKSKRFPKEVKPMSEMALSYRKTAIPGRLSPTQLVDLLGRKKDNKEELRDEFEMPNTLMIESIWRYYGRVEAGTKR